jgi:magnesium transporter
MIRIYTNNNAFTELSVPGVDPSALKDSVWVDILNPYEEEIKFVERYFNISLPTKQEMYGLEISNRLYQENENYFMTLFLLVGSETNNPGIEPVTFVSVGNKLVTVRYVDPQPFREFIKRKEKITAQNFDGVDIMISLLENIGERVGDILEKNGHEIDELSRKVFKPTKITSAGKKSTNYELVLKDIGFYGDIIAKSRESLVSISRLVAYVCQNKKFVHDEEEANRLYVLESDIKSLTEHAKFVASKINFSLEATLGMISIQQNSIIKIFTVATMVFLPPTLIASVYGMNFKHLPELNWEHGYLYALTLMFLSALIPLRYFKKKGWLK